jgi:hypothetical protein
MRLPMAGNVYSFGVILLELLTGNISQWWHWVSQVGTQVFQADLIKGSRSLTPGYQELQLLFTVRCCQSWTSHSLALHFLQIFGQRMRSVFFFLKRIIEKKFDAQRLGDVLQCKLNQKQPTIMSDIKLGGVWSSLSLWMPVICIHDVLV